MVKYRYRYTGDAKAFYHPTTGNYLIPGQYISRDTYDMLPAAVTMKHEVKPSCE